ncbi:MAG TPA: metalloregulator ArsR/SmtB family transcription factor [Nannocystis sp.]|jgi:DNA-binding transcriptional ArsR family regulator
MKAMQTLEVKDALDEADAVKALGALAQAHRLRVFRALVVAGPEGMTPGALGTALDVAPSALSFHLKELSIAGLLDAEQRGRNIVYRARFERMNALLAYLTEHCCQGQECAASAAPCCDTD